MEYLFLIGILVLSLISSCNLGSETSAISGNSSFSNSGKGNRCILSNNIILHKTSIYPDVVSYAYNVNFIIAKQKPERSRWIDYLSHDLYTRYISFRHYLENQKTFKENGYKEQNGKIEWDSLNYQLFFNRKASLGNSSNGLQISKEIADSLIENDPYYKDIFAHEFTYWIIWNVDDSLIGPLTKQEYLIKRKILNIPADLQLEE